jgi:hypothetical protein
LRRLHTTAHIRDADSTITNAHSFTSPPSDSTYTRACTQSTCACVPSCVSTRRLGRVLGGA